MEYMLVPEHAQTFYEAVVQWTVLGISALFVVYSYWLYRLALIAQRWQWKCGFYFGAAGCAVIGLWRIVVAAWYYEDFQTRLTIPATAIVSWIAVTLVFYGLVRWVESVARRVQVTQQNIELMEAVQTEIVEPILRGDPVPRELIVEHQTRSMSFSAGAK